MGVEHSEDNPNLADQHDGECDCASCDQERFEALTQEDSPHELEQRLGDGPLFAIDWSRMDSPMIGEVQSAQSEGIINQVWPSRALSDLDERLTKSSRIAQRITLAANGETAKTEHITEHLLTGIHAASYKVIREWWDALTQEDNDE